MKTRWFLRVVFLVFCFVATERGFSGVVAERRVHVGLSAGIGLPKVPFSQFRAPVSVLGGGAINVRLLRRWVLQLDGYGLTTFSLGRVDEREGELRFNLAWASFDILTHLRGVVNGESFLMAGLGRYHLSQQFNADETVTNTMGINLGLVDWKYRRGWNSSLEIRWHLLFHPSSNPQVLTVTFGVMF